MKQIRIYTFLLVVFLVLKTSFNCAQDIEINKIIPDGGASFGYVFDITQDKDGFMWFATQTGAYKYDGNQLTRFINDPANNNSISETSIKSVYADSDGIVWFGTHNIGLDRYDPLTGIFTHFRHDPKDSTSIADNAVFDILRDHKGKLWIATNQGLDQFDPKTNGFIHFKPEKGDSTTLSDLRVRCLYEDKQGTLWIGTGNQWLSRDFSEAEYGGLNRYNRETNTFTQYWSKPNNPFALKSNKITSIFEDNKRVLWIGTHNSGLFQMNRKKGTFKAMMYDPSHPEIFGNTKSTGSTEPINFITQDTLGGFWIGKHKTGLYYYNSTTQEMFNINGDGTETLEFEAATVAYTSRDGVLWIGSAREGNLYRIKVLHNKIPKPFVSSEKVDALYEEPDGTLWIGKRNDLLRVDKKSGDTLKFNTELNFTRDSENGIFDIVKDRQGTLWVGATTGLFQWDGENQKFTGYHHDPNNENSLSSNYVFAICEDSQNTFWIGTRSGVNQMDRKTGEFTHLNEFRDNYIPSIIEDKSGSVWIGGWLGGKGISRFDLTTKSFKYYNGIIATFVYVDSDSVLWVAEPNGLYIFNPDLDELVRFGNSYSLIGLSGAKGMMEDSLKNLWIATDQAIVRLNRERNETSVFGKNYGIEKGSLFYNKPLKGKNGDIYFGHETGYFQINPSDFPENAIPGEIFFTRFLLFDKEIKPSKDGPLKQPLQETESIKLRYNQNVFSFDFTLIDYINPEETRLLYFLENYDNEWMPGYSKRRASYFNLPPGNYVFRVKGTGSNGIWVEKKVEVIIMPPWYQSWWAYGLYGLLFFAALFAFDRIQRKRVIRKERLKNQERELAQAKEIEKAYTELKSTQAQLIQSEKMASLGELTAGIAHEIQNPLNFVNNFSEVNAELIDELEDEADKGNMKEVKSIAKDIKGNEQKINHHGKRAEAIVKGMLQHSRGNTGQKELTDINALADEYLRLSYHGFRAKDKSFNADFKTGFDKTLPKINVIPQDIGRVLLNLINNAFYVVNEKSKQNIEDYKPKVVVSTSSFPFGEGENRGVKITVQDNGPGIPTEIKDKIFQPFFTTKPTGQGTGLGLSLSYDIVKAHGGNIAVESGENIGTEFTIEIPLKS